MKKMQMLIPIVAILMFASAVTPVLAIKEKPEKIEYALQGYISDMDKGFFGTMSLTVSGKIVGSPDYIGEYSFNYPASYGGHSSYEYDYYEFDEDGASTHYKYSYYEESSFDGWESGSVHTTKWYSPQSTFNSKMEVIWYNGPAATFKADLRPSVIEKSFREGTATGYYERVVKEIIYIENDAGDWDEYEVIQDINESGYSSTTYSDSTLYISFIGKTQSKGRPAFAGTLELWDVTSTQYGQYIVGWGRFGPYDLNIYT